MPARAAPSVASSSNSNIARQLYRWHLVVYVPELRMWIELRWLPERNILAHAEHRAHKRGQRFKKLRLMWRNNCERRGEKYFARAKNDVRQKQTGGYAPPMADAWAKNISPLQWMIGYAKRFANILMIDSAHGGDLVTG